ncbi:TonB-dependent receptor [Aurantibacillus circumpalustris]|uniref:TonB-dependent receptor n=1 Tax=Aurantibacillus circumpalustris TaxID=3036359 RepID=UPI00295A634B|nr:carboxypeptidase-like regulatory domain-containing protein [Aurantibacillus circumpalustris]
MNSKFYFFVLLFVSHFFYAQVTQTVKGKIADRVTGIGLPGAIVQLKSATHTIVTIADNNGFYKLLEVPVGRQSFLFSYTGYKPTPVNDVIVTSGKEAVLNIDLEESTISMDEVVIKAASDTDVVNTMQVSNMKSFSIEETERYAGSRQDPARMAQNFAGIQGTNDSRNDIVIRGNSPAGLLWRLDDIDIPNPNHFAVAGSAGGPQSLINNKYLSNSEFYTGAFPANYGNAMGGVFDLKMRNGNNEKHERTFQLGVLGTELALEGPLSRKSGASYLITYRYSTLALFGSVNFKLGTSAIPKYQDIGVRLNFPTKKAGVFSFSSIGGLSSIDIILSDVHERPKELYGDQNRDQYFSTNMGVGILSNVYAFNSRTVMKTSVAFSIQDISSKHNLIIRDKNFIPNDSLPPILSYNFSEKKSTLAWFIKTKINSKNSLKAGFFVNRFNVNFYDNAKVSSLYDTVALTILNTPYKNRENIITNFYLVQPYLTYVHKFNEKLSLNAGVFSQLLTLNNKFVVEPRASLRYQLKPKQVLSLSYGLHSQMQSTYLYFAIPDTLVRNGVLTPNTTRELDNVNMDFSKTQHAVLGYDFFVSKHFKVKTEVYYQYLWNVPVYAVPSSVSTLNRGATFTRFYPIYSMVNTGTGENYGVEVTFEKLFHKHYFFMLNGSLFESKYVASNGKKANTDFNGNYIVNFLAGLEYAVGKSKKNSINFGTKITYAGGKRYSPANLAASNAVMDVVAQDDKVNTLQFAPYNRVDLRITYKINGKKTGVEIALDLVNILSAKNVLALSYSPDPANRNADPLVKNYQLGFLPLFYVKVDF